MMTFCEKCHEMVAYSTKYTTMQKKIKNRIIEFDGKEASCSNCDSPLFVTEFRDYNLQQLDDAFRKSEGLITVAQIRQIIEKYNIGKRPLSVLLGWGEVTLTRYLEGSIPSKQYSERLYELLNNPETLELILESNKQSITDAAYANCKSAVERIKNAEIVNLDDEKKIDSITKYLLLKASEITPLALQKLLYYIQGFNKVFKDSFLFDDDCEAWAHGPVYTEIYRKYKKFGYNPIEGAVTYEESDLNISDSEKEVVDSVIRNFGCYSGKILERMTHSEHPWLITRTGLSDDSPSNKIIKKDLIDLYFEQVKQKYNMLNTGDIRDYSKELFDKLFT